MRFQIPSQASLHGIVKPHSSLYYANDPAFCASHKMWKIEKKTPGCAWFPSGEMLWKSIRKRACECLFQNRSSIRAANQARVFSVFLFDSFVPTHLAPRANLRLLYRAPAPVLGCVYPSYPWLKAILTFAARMTLWFAATTLYQPLATRYCHWCEFVWLVVNFTSSVFSCSPWFESLLPIRVN